MPYVTTKDGTELYVKDWGTGRPVVLIHGWPLNADSWDDVSYALVNAGYRVIAYDRRGFGRSSQPWSGYDYDTFAEDLAAVMEASAATSATLVGFSMGGGEVARYMSRYGGKGVAQAVLVSSVVPGVLKSDANPDGVPGAMLEQVKAGILKDRPQFFADFFPGFYGNGTLSKTVSQAVIDWTMQMTMMASLKATVACVDAWGYTDFTADLPAFAVPTLVIHGNKDATVPIAASGERAAHGIAGARLLEYDGAPHGIPASHKDRLIEDLLAFLATA
ncbi:alpha/beta fold hydrolase [Sphingomonas abietis]|uniref:Alpha/beta hydrolase n=1 Tax=Sphingomonas abietis TaxID=3012344 RepID=A0ABY7NI87_9SPHN|nr:alpha/beta hydrolase [Sphingomonas abietis]WBO21235.1 alpha/beta hydrolase [Sphingomonas abietis]